MSEQISRSDPRYTSHALPDILQQVVKGPSKTDILNPTVIKTNSAGQDIHVQNYHATTEPPPKPSRTFARSSNSSQIKDSNVNNNSGLHAKIQSHNSSASSHELYLSCNDNNTSGEVDTEQGNHNHPGSQKNDTEKSYSRSISHDPNSYYTPPMDNRMSAISSTARKSISNSFVGSPLAASSPKDTSYMDSTNPLQTNPPPMVPPRRSSFSNAIAAGNEESRKVDANKLTEDEVTKIYQERNPSDRLSKLNSLKAKEKSLVHEMILARY